MILICGRRAFGSRMAMPGYLVLMTCFSLFAPSGVVVSTKMERAERLSNSAMSVTNAMSLSDWISFMIIVAVSSDSTSDKIVKRF